MSKHYKKLIFLLIPACAGFCLALALGSAEPCELCQLCQNKALVKEAVLALFEDPYDANLPEQFDPNFVYSSSSFLWGFIPNPSPILFDSAPLDVSPPYLCTFAFIIAEGDMVSFAVSWAVCPSFNSDDYYSQMAIYRISNGKIVAGWVTPPRYEGSTR